MYRLASKTNQRTYRSLISSQSLSQSIVWFSTTSSDNNNQSSAISIRYKLSRYIDKFKGIEGKSSPKASHTEIIVSGLGSFFGVGALSFLHFGVATIDATMIVASFGASCVLIISAPYAPFSQPRNVVGGQVLSAFCGICANQVVPVDMPFVAGPAAVCIATMAMMTTRTVHPPGGATALIAATGSAHISSMGFYFLVPTAVGTSLLVAVGALYNNLLCNRKYPQYWL